MFRRQNLRPFSMDFSVPDSHLIDAVHQFRDEIKLETRVAKGRDLLFRRNNHMSVLDRVIEIVFVNQY